MKPLNELLDEKEFFVYQERQKGRTYKSIGEELGVSANRASQILGQARRKVHEAKRRDINAAWNDEEVTVKLQRRDIYVIQNALKYYDRSFELNCREIRKGEEPDPESELIRKLNVQLHAAIGHETHPSRVDFNAYWNQDAGF